MKVTTTPEGGFRRKVPASGDTFVFRNEAADGIQIDWKRPSRKNGKPIVVQVLTAVYLAGVLLPCLVTLLTIGREMSWRFALAMAARQAALFRPPALPPARLVPMSSPVARGLRGFLFLGKFRLSVAHKHQTLTQHAVKCAIRSLRTVFADSDWPSEVVASIICKAASQEGFGVAWHEGRGVLTGRFRRIRAELEK